MAGRVLWKAGDQVTLYQRYLAAVAQADYNALVIFFGTSLAVAAWYAVEWLPASWRQHTRVIAWSWAMIFIVASVMYSR